MPAVLLSRLEQQISAFSPTFDRPKIFVGNLNKLLELYSDRTYQAGFEVPSSSKVISYRVPSVVMRTLGTELRHLAKQQPQDALQVADELWTGSRLELKELGISLLGYISLEFSAQVLDRIVDWATLCADGILLENLLTQSNQMILKEKPALWIQKSCEWLDSKDSRFIILGLKSLEPLVSAVNFYDLPKIFDAIHSHVLYLGIEIFPEMDHLLELLCEKYPTETAVFLQQVISERPTSVAQRLLRRILPILTQSQQLTLRQAMDSLNSIEIPLHPTAKVQKKKPSSKKQ